MRPRRALAHQSSQSVCDKQIPEALEIVVAELIDDDQQDQPRSFWFRCLWSPLAHRNGSEDEKDIFSVILAPLTGKPSIAEGPVPVPHPRDDVEASEADDDGR